MQPMYRSLPISLLLVFALLFAQFGGLAHGIEHALAEQSQDQSLPHDRLCDLCATYAQLGSALSGHAVQFATVEQHTVFVSASSATFSSAAFTAFAARAPPHSA